MKERDELLSSICPKDIRDLPPVKPQEPTKDLLVQIIRDILAMYVVDENGNQLSRDEIKCGAINIVKKYLKQLPSAEPKTGHWEDDSPISWICSECGYQVRRYNNTDWCPSCGAKMVDEQESEKINCKSTKETTELPDNMCTQRCCLKNHNIGIIECNEECYNRTLL